MKPWTLSLAVVGMLGVSALAAAQRGGGADFQKGIELKNAGKHADAAREFQELVRRNPRDADSLEQLATLQGWLGRYPDSIATWGAALALSPRNSDYRTGLARVLYWHGETARALKELDRVLADHPNNARTHSAQDRRSATRPGPTTARRARRTGPRLPVGPRD